MSDADGIPPNISGRDHRRVRRAYWALARQIRHAQGGVAGPAGAVESPAAPPADDIEVGFPSFATFLPRIRHGFFGMGEAPVATQHADIELTRRQATEGVRVPLSVTVWHSCPVCGGRGELWPDPCGICDGRGAGALSHQLDVQVPPGVQHGSRLRFSVSPPYAAETRVEVRIAVV